MTAPSCSSTFPFRPKKDFEIPRRARSVRLFLSPFSRATERQLATPFRTQVTKSAVSLISRRASTQFDPAGSILLSGSCSTVAKGRSWLPEPETLFSRRRCGRFCAPTRSSPPFSILPVPPRFLNSAFYCGLNPFFARQRGGAFCSDRTSFFPPFYSTRERSLPPF